jgi:hypothetical protein
MMETQNLLTFAINRKPMLMVAAAVKACWLGLASL